MVAEKCQNLADGTIIVMPADDFDDFPPETDTDFDTEDATETTLEDAADALTLPAPTSPAAIAVAISLKEKLANLPTNSGCYIYKDAEGNIIYIGKTINLRNRVRSYFQKSANHSPKTRRLVRNIVDMEWIVTDSELEALILECNLIKKHKPKYNIRLRDDKHYPYLQLTTSEPFPRLLITRRVKQGDGNRYFGPFTSSHAVHETMNLVYKVFPLVTCRKYWAGTEHERPCLYHHMGRCPEAPCAGNWRTRARYDQGVKDVDLFLSGRQDALVKDIRSRKMEVAAEDMQFERAGKLRDHAAGDRDGPRAPEGRQRPRPAIKT